MVVKGFEAVFPAFEVGIGFKDDDLAFLDDIPYEAEDFFLFEPDIESVVARCPALFGFGDTGIEGGL
jgi:hypothetical protein